MVLPVVGLPPISLLAINVSTSAVMSTLVSSEASLIEPFVASILAVPSAVTVSTVMLPVVLSTSMLPLAARTESRLRLPASSLT